MQEEDLSAVAARLPNCTQVRPSVFVVRTRAGFYKAVKTFWRTRMDGPVSAAPPTKYPAVIFLSIGYNGSHYLDVTCMHVNQLLSILKDH